MADYDDIPQVIVEQHTANLASFLKGALVGAAVGLFFAPGPGQELRRRVKDELDRLRQGLEERIREAQDQLGDRVDEVRHEMNARVDDARRDLEERRADVEYRVRESRAAIQAGIDAARRGRPAPAEGADTPPDEASPEPGAPA